MSESGRPPSASEVTVTHLVLPGDANRLGTCFGGRVLYWMDMAAALAASRHCRGLAVTASLDSVDFLRPIRVGEAVHLRARVTATGRTSMDVEVEAHAEDLATGERRHVSTAYFAFVAVDPGGRPVPVPPVAPGTEEELRRQRDGEARRRARLARLGRLEGPPNVC